MGIFDGARSAMTGNRAYRLHVDANKLANEGKPRQAAEKYEAARKLYEEAVRHGLTAQNILQGYAILLLRIGDFDRAKALMLDMSRMKNLSKDDWFQLRIQFAILQWHEGEIDKAIETMGRAAAYQMNGLVYSTLGMFWVDKAKKTGEFQPALDFNLRALEYDDEDAATLDNMAQLYEAMAEAGEGDQAAENRARALDYYRRANAIKPRQITTLYFLARMLHQNGDDAPARRLLSIRNTLYYSAICPVTSDMMEALAREIGD